MGGGGRIHELFLGKGKHVGHKNVEHVPSMHDVATLRATIDFRQIKSINLLKPSMQGSRDVSASRVPLLDLAKLHTAYSGLHVKHTEVAAVIGKIINSMLLIQKNTSIMRLP